MGYFADCRKQKMLKLFGYAKVHPGSFGVEIEVEGRSLPFEVPKWEVHKEGSLRGEANEYVTKVPYSRENLILAMDNLTETFKFCGSRIKEDSYRASTHIHYNVQERTFNEVLGAIIVFTIIEPLWLRFCGPTRDGNLFCLSAYDCGELPDFISRMIANFNRHGEVHPIFFDRGKYSALNIYPLTSFGSLEFRTFPCSVQKETILKWTTWIENVIQRAVDCKDPNFHSELISAWDNPIEYANSIFGVSFIENSGLTPSELEHAIRLGNETAYEIYRVLKQDSDNNGKEIADD